MKAWSVALKIILAPLGCLMGIAVLATIPWAVYELLSFLFQEAWLGLVFPGFLIYIFLICVPIGLVQLVAKLRGSRSRPFRLPHPAWLATGAVLSIVAGQVFIHWQDAAPFTLVFILAASLPPLTALAIAVRRIGRIASWRHMTAGLLSGSLLSTHLTILLTIGISIVAYAVIVPLRDTWAHIIASHNLENLFYSPALIGMLIAVAVVAPLIEEFTKPLGAFLLAKRLRSPAEAFLVGMAGGVGFAILENMLYESTSADVWGAVAAMRAIGGVLHPLNAGLVAMGWYAVRNGQPGAWRLLSRNYALAVSAHACWNGGLTILFSGVGAHFFGTEKWQMNIYGLGQPAIVILFMVVEAAVLWRTLFAVSAGLRGEPKDGRIEIGLHLVQPRRVAVWAVGAMAVIVPIAALYGPLVARYSAKLLPFG